MLVGAPLLQAVSERILLGFLRHSGHSDARKITPGNEGGKSFGVDLTYTSAGQAVRIKVKPDPYFGVDPVKIIDRSLSFYRPDASHYAFEAISNNLTREPGWMFNSQADQLYYYFVALAQTEQEVSALYTEPDEVFFSELQVERDELHILPLLELRRWFGENFESFTPRPVITGDHSAWVRLIPRVEVNSAIASVATISPVFSRAKGNT